MLIHKLFFSFFSVNLNVFSMWCIIRMYKPTPRVSEHLPFRCLEPKAFMVGMICTTYFYILAGCCAVWCCCVYVSVRFCEILCTYEVETMSATPASQASRTDGHIWCYYYAAETNFSCSFMLHTDIAIQFSILNIYICLIYYVL